MQRAKSVRTSGVPEGANFAVPDRYRFVKALGSGSYGVVACFHDTVRGRDVAIKRVRHVFDNFLVLRRTLREIRLMRHFRHPNLMRLHKVLPIEATTGDLFLAVELMDCDLDTLVHTRHVVLSDRQCRRFCAQVLLGLQHLHNGHVIHRDMKPANIFVRLADGQVKIGDLGLSRGIAVGETGEATHPNSEQLTEYVVTRWYRAPEVLLARSKYGPPVDVWSVGCILYEMWARKALFPGKNSYDQLKRTIVVIGLPVSSDLAWVPPESTALLRRCCDLGPLGEGISHRRQAGELERLTAEARVGQEGLDVLRQMCAFDPARRATVEDALRHPYLEQFSSLEDRALAKRVAPADVAYDSLFDGIGREGEPAALLQLGRLLRREAAREERAAPLARSPRERGPEAPTAAAAAAAARAEERVLAARTERRLGLREREWRRSDTASTTASEEGRTEREPKAEEVAARAVQLSATALLERELVRPRHLRPPPPVRAEAEAPEPRGAPSPRSEPREGAWSAKWDPERLERSPERSPRASLLSLLAKARRNDSRPGPERQSVSPRPPTPRRRPSLVAPSAPSAAQSPWSAQRQGSQGARACEWFDELRQREDSRAKHAASRCDAPQASAQPGSEFRGLRASRWLESLLRSVEREGLSELSARESRPPQTPSNSMQAKAGTGLRSPPRNPRSQPEVALPAPGAPAAEAHVRPSARGSYLLAASSASRSPARGGCEPESFSSSRSRGSQRRFLDDLAAAERHWTDLQCSFNEALGLGGPPPVVLAGVPWTSRPGNSRW